MGGFLRGLLIPGSWGWRLLIQELTDFGGEGGGFLVQAVVGDASGAVAGQEELGVAGSVALEGGAVAVVFPAVQLDDEPGGGPEHVDLVAEDVDIGAVRREVVEAAEALETVLERRAGPGDGPGFGEEAPDRLQGVATVATLADPLDVVQPQHFEPVRFLPGLLEPLEVDDFRVVEQRAGDRGDGNVATGSMVCLVETAAVQANIEAAGPILAPPRGGHVYLATPSLGKTPKRRGAAMAKERSFAARQHGRMPIPALFYSPVAYRIRLTVQAIKAASSQPSLDDAPPKAKSQQLIPTHHPMLLGRQPRQLRLACLLPSPSPRGCPSFCAHTDA